MSDVYPGAVTAPRVAYQEVASQLREQILAGDLSAGDRLPTEAELCGKFGVSRSTIREALRMLSSQGLVMTSRGVGGGSSIAQLEHQDISDMLRDSIVLLTRSEGASVAELLEARDLLEVPAARLAAARRTPEQLDRLRETIPASLDKLDPGRIFQVNRSFHDVILDMTGNRLLHVVTEPLFSVMQSRFLRDRANRAFWGEVMADHAAILDAVAEGDAERAGSEMAAHLAHLRTTYEAIDVKVRAGR